jgi:beta-glucosidase
MNKTSLLLSLVALAATASQAADSWPKAQSPLKADPALEQKINQLLGKMTAEEKVGQLIQPEIKHLTPEDVRKFHIGSVLNGGGSVPQGIKQHKASDWVKMADAYYQASMDASDGFAAIPIAWGTDAVHGVGNLYGATLYPHNIALGATRNPELIRKIGAATAAELAATGLDWNFAPTVAVAQDDRWGRTYESYAEQPELVASYAAALVEGLQGKANSTGWFGAGQVISTAKHFIGDGATLDGIDRGDAVIDEQQLRERHAAGYYSAISAGVQSIMASFNSWQGERLHGHRYLLTEVLKNQMGFDGLVIGDWDGHSFVSGCSPVSCPASINAGVDILMAPNANWKELYANTLAQVKSGEIPAARLDDAVRRILRVKFRSGLFNKGLPSSRALAGQQQLIGSAEHRAVARQAVRESLVLLKNQQQLLPLAPQAKILVTGDGADNIGKQTAGWSLSWQGTGNSNSDFPGATSIYQGMAAAVTAAGGQIELSKDASFKQKPDVAVVVYGEEPYAEMQGDTQNLLYKNGDDTDLKLLKQLKAQGIPVVALFITGRPLWLNRELNAADAFMVVWQPGTEGAGVADVIFKAKDGSVPYPVKGKLSFSWPATVEQLVLNKADANYQPLFAYGYGLSYGEQDKLSTALPEVMPKAKVSQDQLALFKRRPLAPWQVQVIGSENNRALMTGQSISVDSISVKAVDYQVQEDAREVSWNGKGLGAVMLASQNRQDLSAYWRDGAVLKFKLNVSAAPSAAAFVAIGCGPSCLSKVDITAELKARAGKGWQDFAVALNCFPDAGSDFGLAQPPEALFKLVLEPFGLHSSGSLKLSFADVELSKTHKADKNCAAP